MIHPNKFKFKEPEPSSAIPFRWAGADGRIQLGVSGEGGVSFVPCPPARPLVYLAGPMRGYPELNFPAFFEAESALHALGYDVLNPARMDKQDPTTDTGLIIRRDLAAVQNAGYIALMLGWLHSTGAFAEAAVAAWAGKQALYQHLDLSWTFPEPLTDTDAYNLRHTGRF